MEKYQNQIKIANYILSNKMGQTICQQNCGINPQKWRQNINNDNTIEDDDISNFKIGDLSPQNVETYFSKKAKELLIYNRNSLSRMLIQRSCSPTQVHSVNKFHSQKGRRENRSLSDYKEQKLRILKSRCIKISDMKGQYCIRQPFKSRQKQSKNKSLNIKIYKIDTSKRKLGSPQKQKQKMKRRFKRFNHLQ